MSPPFTDKVLSPSSLIERMREHHDAGDTIVFTNGCFDILHAGHVRYLEAARMLGHVLIVGINSDASVQELKGPYRPIVPEDDRSEILAALESVTYVTIFEEPTPAELIELVRPSILVKGGDYAEGHIVGRDFVESYGGRVCTIPLVEHRGTTNIIETILTRYGDSRGPAV